MATKTLNQSKPNRRPNLMPVYPISDMQTEPLDGLPVVTTEQLVRHAHDRGPEYAAGWQAGQVWASKLATFTDLEQLAADARSPFTFLVGFTKGFVAGAVAVWREVNGLPVRA